MRFNNYSGGSKKQETKEDETKRAERSIRHSIEMVEESIHRAVQEEVDTLFHKKSPKQKQDVSQKAKKAVEQGAGKIKEQVEERSEIHHYPYEWPTKAEAHKPHRDFKILHAVEHAEKAVLHAVEEEVNNLFHELEHHDKKEKEQATTVVKKGVKKASEKVKDTHEHRRKWLMMDDNTSIEDYVKTIPAME